MPCRLDKKNNHLHETNRQKEFPIHALFPEASSGVNAGGQNKLPNSCACTQVVRARVIDNAKLDSFLPVLPAAY